MLGVKDADFFVGDSSTELPLVGVAIPTESFFIFAPPLATALYVYLHLLVRKCNEALLEPNALVRKTTDRTQGFPLETQLIPWLLNDFVLRLRQRRVRCSSTVGSHGLGNDFHANLAGRPNRNCDCLGSLMARARRMDIKLDLGLRYGLLARWRH